MSGFILSEFGHFGLRMDIAHQWLLLVPSWLTEGRTSIFAPKATPAQLVFGLSMFVLAIAAAIFLATGGILAYVLIRYRRRATDSEHEPPQIYGSNQIEVAWTVIPILIVFVLIGVSARVIAGVQNASPPPSTTKVTLVGHQWWWEVEYPQFKVHTANEIHVPVSAAGSDSADASKPATDRPIYWHLQSAQFRPIAMTRD